MQRDLTPTMVRQYRAMYDGNIRRGDQAFGALVDELERRGLGRGTVVVVAADHGESLGAHRRIDHNRLDHGVLHTPLLVRLPERQGRVLTHPVMNVDIFPTVLGLVGVDFRGQVRGVDLFDPRRDGYLQLAAYEHRRVVKQGKHCLHAERGRDGLEVTLFDVRADPDETRDLKARRPQKAAELLRAVVGHGPVAERSETMEQLRSLGYVD
jgi:arylsulfatase A-like enzyme